MTSAVQSNNADPADMDGGDIRRSARLTAIELLPNAAIPAIEVAYEAILRRRALLQDIYEAFCERLASMSVEAPSRSAFYRWAQRVLAGKVDAHGLIQADGLLRGSSAKLIALNLRHRASQLEQTAGELRSMADHIDDPATTSEDDAMRVA